MSRARTYGFAALVVILGVLAIHGIVTIGQFIGYASFAGEGGNIYALVIKHHYPVDAWAGIYGVGVRVDGYTNLQSQAMTGGEIDEENLLFDCLAPDQVHEIYAALYNDFDLSTATPASFAEVNALYGFNATQVDNAEGTFTQNITFDLGTLTLTVPGTYTYKIDEVGQYLTFATGIMKDAQGRVGFVIILTSNFTSGYNGDIINFQGLLPVFTDQSSTTYYFYTDPNDECPAGQGTEPLTGFVIGNVSSSTGTRLQDVIVDVAGIAGLSSATGFYNISPPSGTYRIYAVKEGYIPYVNNITVVANETTVHDITMVEESNQTNPDIGPGVDNPGDQTETGVGPGQDVGPGQTDAQGPGEAPPVPFVEQPKQIEGTDYIISLAEIKRKIRIDTFQQEALYIYSFKKSTVTIDFTLTGDNLSSIMVLDKTTLVVEPNGNGNVIITFYGRPPVGTFYGNLTLEGEINATIPVEIEILPKDRIPVEALLMNLETSEKSVLPGEDFKFKTDLRNLLIDRPYPVNLLFTIQPIDGEGTVWSYQTNVYLKTAFSLIRTVELPKDLPPGDYILRANAEYLDLSSSTSTIFSVETPFWSRTTLGLKNWMWLLIIIGLLALAGLGYWYWKTQQSKKKYHLKVEYAELPKPGPRNIYVGKIAETENKTYMNLENFKVHTIVAGSTGGGKSVSAQVIVEEALEREVAVIVFDPTAQWTGMLRPCKDKTMLSLYPFFGMKKTDAKAFNGNVRMITDAREIIDIKKYAKPGEIQVFACHKLDPKDMDLVVANAIREIFHANFQESKPLKILFVFDEVHRLLPKFGGSGDGFLQIERGCREFRKWGLGIVLVSQVLSDFVGTIKANINTEIQMRTRDEGDLERIRQKYGEEVLRSLVKATVGSGMVENPAYNRGKPYFVAFRPLKHSVERMPDEEIEEYNKYNEIIDDLNYSLDQLETEKVDVFDLRLELKLALDKVKQGNFNMVKIYLEGLTPRIDKQWEKLGKKPRKYEKKLVDTASLKADLKKAEEERAQYEKDNKKEETAEKKKEWEWRTDAPPDKLLNLKNGMVVLSLSSLYDEVTAMKDKDYDSEVTPKENRFADWVEKATGLKLLADNIRVAKSKDETVKILELFRDGKKLPEVKPEQLAAAGGTPAPSAPPAPVAPAATPTTSPPPQVAPPAAPPVVPAPASESAPAAPPASAPQAPAPPAAPAAQPAPQAPVASQAPQQSSPEPPKRDLASIIAPPDQAFRLENGQAIMSLQQLADSLPSMEDSIFQNHVGEGYNHFAEWVKGVFHDEQLAGRMSMARTKDELRAAVLG